MTQSLALKGQFKAEAGRWDSEDSGAQPTAGVPGNRSLLRAAAFKQEANCCAGDASIFLDSPILPFPSRMYPNLSKLKKKKKAPHQHYPSPSPPQSYFPGTTTSGISQLQSMGHRSCSYRTSQTSARFRL